MDLVMGVVDQEVDLLPGRPRGHAGLRAGLFRLAVNLLRLRMGRKNGSELSGECEL